ncbi:MAG: tRNA (N(6)-L-threonylcarbamoyladenosine(37)-C(2))-methylthiotransferase MtaB [Ignavibacteriales bacterium]|nr:MAG: tRNA (N(6)-L-threonylcarbamoyladenosine(37)-C(2))-methylthiotransferase MtaB [Ignavibacteriales bacterium]
MKRKVALHTLGCKLNFAETSSIGDDFLKHGFDVVDFNDSADVYVLNTCTVTENAEKECRQIVRRIERKNPDAYIIVTGCYAQLRPGEISSIKGVDAVLGSNEKFQLFSFIKDFEKKDLACIYVNEIKGINEFGIAHSGDADSRTRAYFKIQDGCDYKCSFCTIPLARGISRSMNPEKAVDELKNLVDAGYKEIILTGVNVGDYGNSINYPLIKLLEKFVQVDGDFRIRISSIEPNLLNEEIIDLTSDSEKLCNHFHIPLQSGSPKILKLMQRRYTTSDYQHVIERVKNKIPDAGIGVDVIVGFPGEDENDFMTTYNFLKDLPVSYLHVFTYSERPDTKAISMSGKVDVAERRERNNRLRILGIKKKHEFYKSMIGTDQTVLFESCNDGLIKGFTSNYIRVAHPAKNIFENKLITVRLNSLDGDLCSCNIMDTKNSIDLLAS